MITKKIYAQSLIIVCVMLVASWLLFHSSHRAQDVLVVGTSSGFPPYEMLSPDGTIKGFDIDIANLIAQKMNKKIVIKDMSFDALIVELQQGKIDMVLAGISITQKRLNQMAMVHYSGKPLTDLPLLFWSHIPQEINSVNDLKQYANKTVCVQTGTFQEEIITTYDFLDVKHLETIPDLIMDIKYGKSIAAVLEPKVALSLSKTHPELKILNIKLKQEEQDFGSGIGINKKNTKLINDIELIVKELKADGTVYKLEAHWFEKGA
jgi:arginine transport system substrate-binding protein